MAYYQLKSENLSLPRRPAKLSFESQSLGEIKPGDNSTCSFFVVVVVVAESSRVVVMRRVTERTRRERERERERETLKNPPEKNEAA